ncbi:MAG: hypothetical protein U0T32_12340 [Chitinophagales bacterium]
MEKIFIGIDVSKESLDICIKKGTDFSFEKIDNTVSAVNRLRETVQEGARCNRLAMENTRSLQCPFI